MSKLQALPLYQQVRKEVLIAIQDGEWLADEVIPSEFELATRFGVSQGTVRKALDVLVAERVLYRRQGVGTFVAGIVDELLVSRMLPAVQSAGMVLQAEFITCARVHAGEDLADLLALRRGSALWQINRLLRAAGELTGMEEILFAESLVPGLEARRIRALKGNLQALLWGDYGIRVMESGMQFRAIQAGAPELRILPVELNEPLLQVTRLLKSYDDKPLVWSVAVLKTGHGSFCPRF